MGELKTARPPAFAKASADKARPEDQKTRRLEDQETRRPEDKE